MGLVLAFGLSAADVPAPHYLVSPLPEGRWMPEMPKPCYPILKGQVIRIVFDYAVDLRRLVVYRGMGCRDWAIPKELEVSVDGGLPRKVALKATNLSSGPFKLKPGLTAPADPIAPDGAASVTSLVVRVTDIATTYNQHGIVSLGLGRAVLADGELNAAETAGDGLALTVQAPRPVRDAELLLATTECGEETLWRHSPVNLAAGRNEIRVSWRDFVCAEEPWRRLQGFHVDKFALLTDDPAAGAGFSLSVKRDGTSDDPGVFATLPAVDGIPAGDGWYRGVPSDGFGRFGWRAEINGLLSLRVDGDAVKSAAFATDVCAFRYGSGPGLETAWAHSDNNAHTLFTERLLRLAGDLGMRKSTYGYREFDLSRRPERLVAGIQSPGVLVNSADRVLSMTADGDYGELMLLFADGKDVTWKSGAAVDLTGMREGWLVIGAEKRPKTPLMIAFDRKPTRAVKAKNGFVFEFADPRGWTGFAYPGGYRAWTGKIGENDDKSARLADDCRRLGALLRNYPIRSEMRFREDGDGILFEERPAYLRWRNAWGELGDPLVPCPPVVALAADGGYPVSFPDGRPETAAADTKFGPYRGWKADKTGGVARYRLPKGEKDFPTYPCPTDDPGARRIGDAIHEIMRTWTKSETRHGQSVYHAWVRWTPSSMAQAFLTPAQHDVIATNWTDMIDRIYDEHWWSVRREPIGGKAYPVSFAWMDEAEKILGDINSGIGAALTALDAHARFTGDWRRVEDSWELVRRIPLYFYYGHDWTMMISGSREHTCASGIDMDVIAYEGMAGLARMSAVLGRRGTGAFAEMILSRYALAYFARLGCPAWQRPGLRHEDWGGIGGGCGEDGFWVLRPGAYNQGVLNAMVALNYTWGGTYASVYAQLLKSFGADFWKHEEYVFVDKVVKEWRKDVPDHRNEHHDSVSAHLYWRLLLGASRESIARELEAQGDMANPPAHVASNCGGLYALYYGGESPVVLDEFAPARLLRFDWDRKGRRVTAELECDRIFTPRVSVRQTPKSAPATLRDLKPGRTVLEWTF